MQARELEAQRIVFAGPVKKFDALLVQMADVASEIREMLRGEGALDLGEIFFPLRDPGRADWGTHETLSAHRAAFSAAFVLLNTREAGKLQLYDRKKEIVAAA